MQRVYKIKKALKAPMSLAVIISIPVFMDVINRGYETKILVMACMLIVLFYLFTLNNLLKQIKVGDGEIIIRSLFGSNRIHVEDIKLVDGVTIGSRQFITISAKKNSLIPNTFDDFIGIIDSIREVVKEEAIGKGLTDLRENVVTRKSDITMAWITVILLIIIVVIRFFPQFFSL
ncbi:MAG: hypothetical protein ABSC14_02820 [Desulfomonilia bacterium]|jgi:hypothetical protein